MAIAGLLIITGMGLIFWQIANPSRYDKRNGGFSQLPVFFGSGGGLLFYLFLLVCWWRPFQLFWIAVVFGVLLLLLLFSRRITMCEPEKLPPPPQPWTRREKLVCLLIILVLFIAGIGLFAMPLTHWDTRIIWAFKAKVLAAENTIVSETFRDPYRMHIHPRYPLLAPWLTALLSDLEGGFKEIHWQLVIFTFALLSVQLFFQLNCRENDRQNGLLACLLLVFTGSWLEGLFSANVEMVLCFYFMLALFMAIQWLEKNDFKFLVYTGFFLACGATTKNEGGLLAICLCLGLTATLIFQKKGWRARFWGGFPFIILLAILSPWFWHVLQIPPVSDENYISRLSFPIIINGTQRLGTILFCMGTHAADITKWHLLWLLCPLLFIWGLLNGRFSSQRFQLFSVIIFSYLAGITLIYILSPWRNIAAHIQATFDRVMLPLLPMLIMFLLEIIKNDASASKVNEPTDKNE